MQILIAGFQHETNTFAPTRADWAAFLRGDSFPAYVEGPAMLARYTGSSLPAGGFIAEAQARGWQLLPSCWAGATPSAQVTREAFERIAGTIVEAARSALAGPGLDAIYLDLHGAAVAEHIDDAEGELLARLRALVGPGLPIVASLDLHANVTQQMLQLADALVAYRSYPHVDTEATGRLAARLLERRLARGGREPFAARRIPFLIPINAGCTMIEPAGALYRSLPALDERHGTVASVAMGFPAADFPECGPVVWAYGDAAQAVADALYADICEPASRWRVATHTPDEAVARALALAGAEAADRPVVIADTQDNPARAPTAIPPACCMRCCARVQGSAFRSRWRSGCCTTPRRRRRRMRRGRAHACVLRWAGRCPPGRGNGATRRWMPNARCARCTKAASCCRDR